MATGEQLNSRGQAWFCTTELPSDLVVEVENMNFHLQKSPVMSKSRKLHQLITDQEENHSSATTTEAEEGRKHSHLVLADFPGGSETFELAAKFCFGAKIDLTSSNVVPLRCAGEFLEMTEEHSEENLISKTETFLSQSVLNSVKDSIIALKSSQRLMPLAETLGIPRRCINSIVSAQALFRWPVSDSAYTLRGRSGRKGVIGSEEDSWFEELTLLGLPMFKQLIIAMKGSELKPEMIETCLMQYAKKHIPGLSRSNRKALTSSSSEAEQKELLEIVISNLSPKHSTQVRFLFAQNQLAQLQALETSVLSICLNITTTIYTIAESIGSAASTRISNALGAGNPQSARVCVYAAMTLAASEAILVSSIIFACRQILGYVFSNEQDVADYVTDMVPLLSLSVILDSLYGTLSGIARGCGWQHLGAYVNLGAYYGFGIPTAAILGFWILLGGKGLWIGILTGSFCQTVMLSLITTSTNWEEQAIKARERIFQRSFSVEGGLI